SLYKWRRMTGWRRFPDVLPTRGRNAGSYSTIIASKTRRLARQEACQKQARYQRPSSSLCVDRKECKRRLENIVHNWHVRWAGNTSDFGDRFALEIGGIVSTLKTLTILSSKLAWFLRQMPA